MKFWTLLIFVSIHLGHLYVLLHHSLPFFLILLFSKNLGLNCPREPFAENVNIGEQVQMGCQAKRAFYANRILLQHTYRTHMLYPVSNIWSIQLPLPSSSHAYQGGRNFPQRIQPIIVRSSSMLLLHSNTQTPTSYTLLCHHKITLHCLELDKIIKILSKWCKII